MSKAPVAKSASFLWGRNGLEVDQRKEEEMETREGRRKSTSLEYKLIKTVALNKTKHLP